MIGALIGFLRALKESVLVRLRITDRDSIYGAAPGQTAMPECSRICIFDEKKTVVFARFAVSSLNGGWLKLWTSFDLARSNLVSQVYMRADWSFDWILACFGLRTWCR